MTNLTLSTEVMTGYNCSALYRPSSNESLLCTDSTLTADGTGESLASAEMYLVPIIAGFGIVGNTLAFIVFRHKSIRENSSSFFLAVRSLSDIGFLVTLLIIWTSSVFGLYLSRILLVCKTLIFLSYVFGCLSVWLVVLVTAENYIRICKPALVKIVCKTRNAKLICLLLVISILISYSFPFWTMTDDCTPLHIHYEFVTVMVYIDSVFTLFLPSIVILILMAQIAVSLINSNNRRRRLGKFPIAGKMNIFTKVTQMLFAVTLVFVILNIPSHVVRLRLVIASFFKNSLAIRTSDAIAQSIATMLYYASMAINVIIYLTFGSRFRQALVRIIRGEEFRTNRLCHERERMTRMSMSMQTIPTQCSTNNNLLNIETSMKRAHSAEI
ncbi:hypothetical protein DPMN_086361 [Dreissena polymorpha]|uniref:G-protein coupled receptors family 1 profile domain-containing protein n=2 Tax=Dreissena polymorpha TaxID=45954 RepID=A0A9D4QUL9_DREPO|nr:hypothetical protein DPMN_086361 [Dreissena polymorpha]